MKPGLSSLKCNLIGSILYSGFPCEQYVLLSHGPIKLCDDAHSEGRALWPMIDIRLSSYANPNQTSNLNNSLMPQRSPSRLISAPITITFYFFRRSPLLLPSQKTGSKRKAKVKRSSCCLRNIIVPFCLVSKHCPAAY
jgi:hypothetical protein